MNQYFDNSMFEDTGPHKNNQSQDNYYFKDDNDYFADYEDEDQDQITKKYQATDSDDSDTVTHKFSNNYSIGGYACVIVIIIIILLYVYFNYHVPQNLSYQQM